MIKQHFGSILIAAAILAATFVYARVNRYEPVPGNSGAQTFDGWKGKLR